MQPVSYHPYFINAIGLLGGYAVYRGLRQQLRLAPVIGGAIPVVTLLATVVAMRDNEDPAETTRRAHLTAALDRLKEQKGDSFTQWQVTYRSVTSDEEDYVQIAVHISLRQEQQLDVTFSLSRAELQGDVDATLTQKFHQQIGFARMQQRVTALQASLADLRQGILLPTLAQAKQWVMDPNDSSLRNKGSSLLEALGKLDTSSANADVQVMGIAIQRWMRQAEVSLGKFPEFRNSYVDGGHQGDILGVTLRWQVEERKPWKQSTVGEILAFSSDELAALFTTNT